MLVDAPQIAPAIANARVPAAHEAAANPATTRAIERLTLVIFWLLIMEGALRKWVVPGYSHVLFFVRDPFVLLLYWHAVRGGVFRRPDPFLVAGLVFAAAAPLLALAQIAQISDSRIAAVVVYGWRQYFLYLPLPFVLARVLDQRFIWSFARHVFVAVILSAPLMYAQFHSPPSSILNRGSAEDEALQFKSFDLIDDKIRASGFFTSSPGVGNLVPCALAFVLAAWLTPAGRRRISTLMLLLAAVATASCLALSGSRTAFAAAALVGLSSMFVGLLVGHAGMRLRALVLPTVLFGAGAVLYPLLFPDALDAMTARVAAADTFGTASGGYGILGRALSEPLDFLRLVQSAPIAGYGLGMGGNGHIFLGTLGDELLRDAYAETDWSRHIVDLGPVLGVLFILYRIVLTGELFRRTVQATMHARDPLPVLLFGYIGIGVLEGQLTGNGTTGGFLWLFLGVTLASCRIAMDHGVQPGGRSAA